MYFKRKFKAGGEDYDPRQITWAEFECTNCGELSLINVTGNGTFDYERIRVCPVCKSLGKDDYKKNLKMNIEELTIKKTKIEIELEKKIRELELLEMV